MNFIGMNFGIVEEQDAKVSVMDHGFLYGMGLFETFRTYGGTPFLLERHLKRLSTGCHVLGIPYKVDIEATSTWIFSVMKANGLGEAYIRYTVSAGEDILGLPADNYNYPNHILTVKELPKTNPGLYVHGKGLQRLHARRNTPEGPVRLKSLHYMNNILAKRELATYPIAKSYQAEGLMLNAQDIVAEGIVSNIFFARLGMLYTPHVDTGILPGITREVVLELAMEQGLAYEEGYYTWSDLLTADEIWMTNSIQELVPVTTLIEEDGSCITIGSGTVGPITTRFLTLYRQKAGITYEDNNL
ncbi:aminotransferase class IV [Paenibacillus crassostreae]|uniref:4-amino-4-deoxychorismate lyase n=1 Tax=Paenibacillus crassostreae TaxID=1763538 RepID=A0A162N7M0_9BACL|nr:aminotransferase class IV [Paenibacillus crassostreae]AOZ92790.1 4-amino-4-deoxychorismate lyase [Paenibacillus crassostreae]OAB71212.1 4-amino-4-deoxychorismate lyase [Paenibacillus crassostreae]